MAKYLMLKHYRGAPTAVNDVPLHEWTPAEFDAHMKYMGDFMDRLKESGEFVDTLALAPEGTFVRSDAGGGPPLTSVELLEAKDLVAGWMVIDVDTHERAVELAAELSAAPGKNGEPIREWLELRPLLTERPALAE